MWEIRFNNKSIFSKVKYHPVVDICDCSKKSVIKVNVKTYPYKMFRGCIDFPNGCLIFKAINNGKLKIFDFI